MLFAGGDFGVVVGAVVGADVGDDFGGYGEHGVVDEVDGQERMLCIREYVCADVGANV